MLQGEKRAASSSPEQLEEKRSPSQLRDKPTILFSLDIFYCDFMLEHVYGMINIEMYQFWGLIELRSGILDDLRLDVGVWFEKKNLKT